MIEKYFIERRIRLLRQIRKKKHEDERLLGDEESESSSTDDPNLQYPSQSKLQSTLKESKNVRRRRKRIQQAEKLKRSKEIAARMAEEAEERRQKAIENLEALENSREDETIKSVSSKEALKTLLSQSLSQVQSQKSVTASANSTASPNRKTSAKPTIYNMFDNTPKALALRHKQLKHTFRKVKTKLELRRVVPIVVPTSKRTKWHGKLTTDTSPQSSFSSFTDEESAKRDSSSSPVYKQRVVDKNKLKVPNDVKLVVKLQKLRNRKPSASISLPTEKPTASTLALARAIKENMEKHKDDKAVKEKSESKAEVISNASSETPSLPKPFKAPPKRRRAKQTDAVEIENNETMLSLQEELDAEYKRLDREEALKSKAKAKKKNRDTVITIENHVSVSSPSVGQSPSAHRVENQQKRIEKKETEPEPPNIPKHKFEKQEMTTDEAMETFLPKKYQPLRRTEPGPFQKALAEITERNKKRHEEHMKQYTQAQIDRANKEKPINKRGTPADPIPIDYVARNKEGFDKTRRHSQPPRRNNDKNQKD